MNGELKQIKKLIVKNIENFTYMLSDESNDYEFNFEFYDIDVDREDIIYIHDSLLRKKHELLSFGAINGIYGRNIIDENDPDLLVIKKGDNLIYLKRYYG